MKLKMSKCVLLISCLIIVILFASFGSRSSVFVSSQYIESAFYFFANTMDRYHKTFDVYSDVGSAGNHFLARGKMPDNNAAVEMDECWTDHPYSGTTCIKCSFWSQEDNWGGFYFLNGILQGSDVEPSLNWGDEPNAGFNLTGATKVTFYAKGNEGNEIVEFFVGGVGWSIDQKGNSITPEKPYPDSFPKVSKGYLTLTKEWEQYTIYLSGEDLSYVLGGFGWCTSAKDNNGQDITFYLDDIQWDKQRLDDLRLLFSYETKSSQDDFDVISRNVAYTYDNALALLAFLVRGEDEDLKRAKILADSLVYAIKNDRFYTDARLRNAYMGADLIMFPGWTPNDRIGAVRIPGSWNCIQGKWIEDIVQVSTSSGNIAWAIIALVSAYQEFGEQEYLQGAKNLGDWIEKNCKDSQNADGYTAGFEGWEPNPKKLIYKSTEHNLNLYVAFSRLFKVTREEKWRKQGQHAKKFVESMWDNREGKFWSGTDESGIDISKYVIPLDVQALSILAFNDDKSANNKRSFSLNMNLWSEFSFHRRANQDIKALRYAERYHAVDGGFDFDTDRDGIWYEGTAQIAAAYQAIGKNVKSFALLNLIETAQFESGAIPAASKDGLTTGFLLPTPGNPPWLYYHRGHVGSTAWYIFAKFKVNPYWIN